MKISPILSRSVTALLTGIVLLLAPLRLAGQSVAAGSTVNVVLLRGAAAGMSAKDADSFYSSLQGELAQFAELKVYAKADLARGLNKEENASFAKCSDLTCLQSFARKAGMQRMLLVRITKKNTSYQFQSDEYDVTKLQRLSGVSENAECESGDDVEHFIRKAAIKVGQAATHDASVPESLQESKSNLWWYIGGAATVGIGAGVYYAVSHKKSSSTSPTSLPLPPDFP